MQPVYIISYSSDLVKLFLREFGADPHTHRVFDPFVGCGSTVLAAKQVGFGAWGIDILPVAVFVARVKLRGAEEYNLDALRKAIDDILHMPYSAGFSKGEAEEALRALKPAVVEVAIGGLDDGYLLLADDAQRLRDFAQLDASYVFFLPSLDPYIMGYRDRGRFLAAEHRAKVFDRAGNAMPTVWVNGRVVGAWGQRKDGSVIYGFFESVGEEERALLEGEVQRLEDFLVGEFLPSRTHTPFTRALEK